MSSTPDAPRSNTPWEDDPQYSAGAPGSVPPPMQRGGGGIPPQSGSAGTDDRSMAIIAHLSTIAALLLSAGWLSFVGPLIVWLVYKDRSAYVREAAAGAFNFNIAMWLVSIAGWIAILTIIGAVVGIPLLIIAFVLQVVFHILGAVKANRGERFQYPFQLRLLS